MTARWHRDEVNVGDKFVIRETVYPKSFFNSHYPSVRDRVLKVIAIADKPTVTLEGEDGKRESHVIASVNFARFKKLVPRGPGEAS